MLVAIIVLTIMGLITLAVLVNVACKINKLVEKQEEWMALEKEYYKSLEKE